MIEELPNIPVECEDRECNECSLSNYDRESIDCPFIE